MAFQRNDRFLTPPFFARRALPTLPVSDASKTEDKIQKTGNRMDAQRRRQKPVVGFGETKPKIAASKTGSFAG
jgi:hypothetical protein